MQKKRNVEERIASSDNKIKTMWKVINEERASKQSDSKYKPIILIENEQLIQNTKEVCDIFNQYYINVPVDIENDIKCQNINKCKNFTKKTTNNSIYLNPVDENEILKYIDELSNSKSTGPDEQSNYSIKIAKKYIAKPLTHLINLSFETGIFPTNLKISKISPVFKNGDETDKTKYRPIALISPISKIFEKAFCKRFTDFFCKNNTLSPHQYGFRKNMSTVKAIMQMIDEITNNLDNKQPSIGIFLDLSKAFDCVDFNILLKKLENYGIRGNALKLTESYIRNRLQYVQIPKVENNKVMYYTSQYATNKFGVPQGSVAGPLLYLIYVNSLIKNTENSKMMMYADDTTCLFSNNNLRTTEMNTIIKINSLYQEFAEHNLSINEAKTKCILFKTVKSQYNFEPTILIDDTPIDNTDTIKFLGITIQDQLKWDAHITQLTAKLTTNLFVLYRISKISTKETTSLTYYALIHSLLSYGIEIWGSSNETNLDNIFKYQKRAIRYISGLAYKESCKQAYKELKILTVPALLIYKTVLIIKDKFHNLPKLGDKHNYETRNKNVIAIPQHNTTLFEKTTKFRGMKFYNKLPDLITSIGDINKFKKELYIYLINKTIYKLSEL